jgi:hypothetical protein
MIIPGDRLKVKIPIASEVGDIRISILVSDFNISYTVAISQIFNDK